jgi:hypothetical protein
VAAAPAADAAGGQTCLLQCLNASMCSPGTRSYSGRVGLVAGELVAMAAAPAADAAAWRPICPGNNMRPICPGNNSASACGPRTTLLPARPSGLVCSLLTSQLHLRLICLSWPCGCSLNAQRCCCTVVTIDRSSRGGTRSDTPVVRCSVPGQVEASTQRCRWPLQQLA